MNCNSECKCRICGERTRSIIYAKNRRLNDGRKFQYLICDKCDTLQLNENIDDMTEYYGTHYGAHKIDDKMKYPKVDFFHKLFVEIVINSSFWWRVKVFRKYLPGFMILCGTKIKTSMKILDVGCGNGKWLYDLKKCGYNNLYGCDLFAWGGVSGIEVIKSDIFGINLDNKFDLITFHHSFEHMNNPFETLARAKALLNDNGLIIIRIPLWKSKAWEMYGTDWYQLDPPIHYYLYTEKSISFICKKIGLQISNVIYDSTPNQFYISDRMKYTAFSYNEIKNHMDKKELQKYNKLTEAVNRTKKGDQAIFYIMKS